MGACGPLEQGKGVVGVLCELRRLGGGGYFAHAEGLCWC